MWASGLIIEYSAIIQFAFARLRSIDYSEVITMPKIFLIALISTAILGCNSKDVNRTDINQFVEVIFARVINIKPVKFDSKADEAVATGAIGGAIENSYGDSEDVVAGAITGALVSALIVTIEEGSRHGLLVDLIGADTTPYHIVVNRQDIQIGQCLQLIKGFEVSVVHVDGKYCATQTEQATAQADAT
jgi:outer membrane lipoprotein SlyB